MRTASLESEINRCGAVAAVRKGSLMTFRGLPRRPVGIRVTGSTSAIGNVSLVKISYLASYKNLIECLPASCAFMRLNQTFCQSCYPRREIIQPIKRKTLHGCDIAQRNEDRMNIVNESLYV